VLDPLCSTRKLLDRVGTKWTSLAVRALAAAPAELRSAELKRQMPGVSQKMLSVTLRSLQRDGLVSRRVVATVPPSVYYGLTELGRSLEEPLAGLREWAEVHMPEVDANAAAYDRAAASR
jgi:DNA-binding HxlR family transcriptional regulator